MGITALFTRINSKRLAIISGIIFVFGIIFGYVLFPKILAFALRYKSSLRPGSQMRGIFSELPFALDFKIYIFNITNPDEVHKGGKPKLQEIGPYHFQEWKFKYNFIDDPAEDTLEYDYKNKYIYDPSQNGPGLTGDEIVCVGHPVIQGMALSVNVDRAPLLPLINEAIKGIFHNPKTMFWTGRAMDLLFDGIPIDCSSDSYETQAVCSEIKSPERTSFRSVNDTTLLFSLFHALNDTSIGRFTISRGVKNIRTIGLISKFNGEPELDKWAEDECNQIRGTDQTIFPPHLNAEDGLWGFEPAVCRSMVLDYEKPSKFAGMRTRTYSLNIGDVSSDPSTRCFCRDEDDCPLPGTLDLFPCTELPLTFSLPHFHKSDPSILENFESGINPDDEKHAFRVQYHPTSGSLMVVSKRAQISWQVEPLEDIDVMQEVRPMLLPMFWIEESMRLPRNLKNLVKYQLVLSIKLGKLTKIVCIFFGLCGLIVAGIVYAMQHTARDKTQTFEQKKANLTAPNCNTLTVIDKNTESAYNNFH